MKRSFVIAVFATSLSATAYAQRAGAVSDAGPGIAATWAAFIPVFVSKNASAAVAAFFATDAINMVSGSASDSGRVAIEKGYSTFFTGRTISDAKQVTEEVQTSGRTAYERGTITQTVTAVDGKPVVQRSRYMAVWARQSDGTWKCTRFMMNALPRQ